MKNKLLTVLTTALVSALFVTFIAGCSQEPPETAPSSRGLVRIDLSSNVQVNASARTALPPLLFTSYKLVFDPAADGAPDITKTIDSGDWDGTVEITSVSYTKLTVYGYDVTKEAITDSNHTAYGVSGAFEVGLSALTPVSVPMTFKPPENGEEGTLAYTITNTSGYTLTAATVTLTPLGGGASIGPNNITLGSEQLWENVPAGYYLASVTLEGAGLRAVKSDVAHIYQGGKTTLNWTFAATDFHSAIEEVWLVGSMVETGWSNAQGVLMTSAADGTFTWEGDVTAGSTFRFHLTDVSGYENKWYGDWFSSASDGGNYTLTIVVGTPTTMYFWNGLTDGNWTIAAAGYYRIVVDPFAPTVTVTQPVVVTSVTIDGGDVSVNKGGSKSFTATVEGHNSYSQEVTWSVSGGKEGTAFSGNTLTIAADETASTLTVTATSTADATKSGTITVTVAPASTPTVTAITVSAAGAVTEVTRNAGTLQFTASVAVTNDATQEVTWKVSGKDKDGGTVTPKGDTTVSETGLLTVAADEEAVDLVVTAASKQLGFETTTGTASVFVRKYGDVYLVGTEFGGWDSSTTSLTYTARGVYTTTGLMSKGSYFRFTDNSGTYFEPYPSEQEPAGTVDAWRHSPTESTSWKVVTGGSYAISLNTVAEKVTFTSTPLTIAISGGAQGLAPGEDTTFTLTSNAAELGAAVTWSVTGGGINDSQNPTGTQVATDGKLTLGGGEWITHTLTVKAAALGEESTAQVAVIDPAMNIIGEPNRDGSGNWSAVGAAMTRNGTTFTWTGTINDYSGRRNFRLSPSNTDNWTKTWIVPAGTNESDNKSAWVTNSVWQNLSTERIDNSTTERTWYIANTGDQNGGGNGNYTIVYDAVTKTLTVTKDS